jgi:hypothetical protein
MNRRWLWGLLLIWAGVCAACSAQVAPPLGSNAAPAPIAAAAQGGGVEKVNMDEVFPPDDGRDLVLENCVNCHTIVPIALARKIPDEWISHRTQHRQRVSGLSEADADRLWGYLTRNFYPGRPIPQLPEDLLQTWTSY